MAVEKFSAIVGANIREFTRKMKEVDRKMKEAATGANVDVTATIKDFQKDVKKVMKDVALLKGLNTDITIDAEIRSFEKKAKEVMGAVAVMDNMSPDIDVGLITRQFQLKMQQIRADMMKLKGYSEDIEIDADISRFNRTMKILKAKLLAINGKTVWINVKANLRDLMTDFRNTRNRITDAMRDMGEIVGQTIQGALITIIPTLSPIISSLIGLIGSLGVMIGVLSASTFALATAFVGAGAAAVAFGAVAIPTIKSLFDESKKLTAEQQKARDAYDQMTKTYDRLVKLTETPVLRAFEVAMKSLDQILNDLEPLFIRSSEAVAKLMEQLQTNINSKPIQDFFNFLNQFGAGLLETVMQSVGNLIKGLLSMMTAFGPLAIDTADGFLAMTQRFAEWAEGLKSSDSFNKFVDYVREHMPIIRSIFGDAFKGIIGFFTAFSDNASGFMKGLADMMGRFKEWANTLGENDKFQQFLSYIRESAPRVLQLVADLFNTLISLGVAFAPVGDFLIEKISTILQWFNAKIGEDGWFKSIVGWAPVILGSLLTLITPVAMIATLFRSKLVQSLLSLLTPGKEVGGVLSKLGPIFTGLGSFIGTAIGWFGKIASAVMNFVPTVMNLASKALPWLMRGFTLLTGPIGLAIAIITTLITFGIALYKNWDTVSAKAKEVGEAVGKWFQKMGDTVTLIWNTLKTAIPKIIDNMKQEMSAKVEQMKNDASKKFNELKTDASNKVSETKTAVINKFTEIVSGVGEKLVEMKNSITTKWDESIKFLKGINLVQIGKDIIGGLVKGITSRFDSVASSLSGLAEKIPSWVKTALKIKSPSRVMADVGQHIPTGVAMGIDNNLGVLKKSSKNLSESVAPNFKQIPKATEKTMKEVQRVVNKEYGASIAEITKLEKEFAKKRADATSTAEKNIAVIRARASESKKGMTKSQLLQISKIEADAAAKRRKLSAEEEAKIQKLVTKTQGDTLKALETHANAQVELEKWTTKELVEFWQTAVQEFKAGTDERIKAQIKYKQAMDTLTKERFDKEKKYIDRATKYGNMSNAQQLKAYEQYMKGYAKGSEEQVYYEEMIFDKKKEIHSKLVSLSEEMLSKVKDTQQKQIDGEKELREAFAQTYSDRKEQLKGFAGLFDEFKGTDMKDVDLLGNLEGQVDAMYEWVTNMDKLSVSGLSTDLLAEIQSLGVNAANEVRALTEMTADQLQEYQNLWDMKNDIASNRAGFELSGMASDTENQIRELNATTSKELSTIRAEFKKEMDGILYGPIESFDLFNATLPEIGKNAVNGFVDGMKSAEALVRKQATNISNIVREALSSISNMNAQMQLTGGMNIDTSKITPQVVQAINISAINSDADNDDTEPTVIQVHVHQNWNGEEVLTYVEEHQARNYNIELYTKGDDW